ARAGLPCGHRGVSIGGGACLGCPLPPAPSPASGRGGEFDRTSAGAACAMSSRRTGCVKTPRWAI
ncbi:MAG: hypothetical protein AVDCRST_MAG89-3326, partial [uncultured Gemmatimonadetes bacterium]